MKTFWQTFLFWVLLSGCIPDTFSAHGYLWYLNEKLPICSEYYWYQEDPIKVQEDCQGSGHEYMLGCSFVDGKCIVVSMYDEVTAKQVFLPGTDWSHRDHEVIGHITNRWSHP